MLQPCMPTMSLPRLPELVAQCRARHPEPHYSLDFSFTPDLDIRVVTDHEPLQRELSHYFRQFHGDFDEPHLVIEAFEEPIPDLTDQLDFIDWKREPGKKLKERIADIEGGRIVWKTRTGMHYLLGGGARILFGPASEHPNQVVNFVNAQIIIHYLHAGYALCHAAAVIWEGKGLALAANSGGGKSTTALHIMHQRGATFSSNDRLLVRPRAKGPGAVFAGVPKLPRINPGTILHNPALLPILPVARRDELLTWERDRLWELEEKYDADVEALFGADRYRLHSELDAFVLLNWDRHDPSPPRSKRVDLKERPDLVEIIMKPPGPFYEPPEGDAPTGVERPDPAVYLEALEGVPIYEVTGGADFDAGVELCAQALGIE